MAEVDTGGGKGGKKGPKKVSTKIDMTPMVDLAFLLITFFMLTTTFSKPKTMEVNMPDKTQNKDDKMKVKESQTVTILLAEENRIFYYTGVENPVVQETNYSDQGIRKVVLNKIREIKASLPNENAIFVIKAKNEANFKNLVDILDEMAITNAQIYAIVDILPEDLELIEKAKKNTAAVSPA